MHNFWGDCPSSSKVSVQDMGNCTISKYRALIVCRAYEKHCIVWWSRLLSLTSVRVQVCTALATILIMQLFDHFHTFAEAPNGPQGNTNDICWPNTFPRLAFNVLLFPANNCKSNGRVSLCLLTIHFITQIQNYVCKDENGICAYIWHREIAINVYVSLNTILKMVYLKR